MCRQGKCVCVRGTQAQQSAQDTWTHNFLFSRFSIMTSCKWTVSLICWYSTSCKLKLCINNTLSAFTCCHRSSKSTIKNHQSKVEIPMEGNITSLYSEREREREREDYFSLGHHPLSLSLPLLSHKVWLQSKTEANCFPNIFIRFITCFRLMSWYSRLSKQAMKSKWLFLLSLDHSSQESSKALTEDSMFFSCSSNFIAFCLDPFFEICDTIIHIFVKLPVLGLWYLKHLSSSLLSGSGLTLIVWQSFLGFVVDLYKL